MPHIQRLCKSSVGCSFFFLWFWNDISDFFFKKRTTQIIIFDILLRNMGICQSLLLSCLILCFLQLGSWMLHSERTTESTPCVEYITWCFLIGFGNRFSKIPVGFIFEEIYQNIWILIRGPSQWDKMHCLSLHLASKYKILYIIIQIIY